MCKGSAETPATRLTVLAFKKETAAENPCLPQKASSKKMTDTRGWLQPDLVQAFCSTGGNKRLGKIALWPDVKRRRPLRAIGQSGVARSSEGLQQDAKRLAQAPMRCCHTASCGFDCRCLASTFLNLSVHHLQPAGGEGLFPG